MDRNEYNKYSMYRAVKSTLEENAEKVKAIPALLASLNRFSACIGVIEKKDTDYLTVAKGSTTHKRNVGEELIEQMMSISNSLFVFADETGDTKICEITDVKESLLKKMRSSELLQKGKSIFDLLAPIQEKLIDYGVDANKITQYNNKIKEFGGALDNKDIKHTDAVTSRDTLYSSFADVDLILKNKIDKLMVHMRTDESEFYNKYQQARIIKDLGIRHQKDVPPPPEPKPATV